MNLGGWDVLLGGEGGAVAMIVIVTAMVCVPREIGEAIQRTLSLRKSVDRPHAEVLLVQTCTRTFVYL